MRSQSDVVGAEEAADILGVSRSTLFRWVKDGKVTKLPTRGKKALFLRDNLKPPSGVDAKDIALLFGTASRRFEQMPDAFGPRPPQFLGHGPRAPHQTLSIPCSVPTPPTRTGARCSLSLSNRSKCSSHQKLSP